MVTGSSFEDERYWSARLEETFSLAGAGWLGLSEPFNRWMYAVRRRLFLRAVRAAVPERRSARVLDVGSGTGFYVRLWHELGVEQVTGSDLTEVAVARLNERHPRDRFVQLDIATHFEDRDLGEFHAVSAMDVLFHIVDDDRYERAVGNLSRMLRPGGVLVFSENLLHGDSVRTRHQVSRDIGRIRSLLDRNELEVMTRRPMFVLMNTPVDSRSRLLHRWWGTLTAVLRRWPQTGRPLGAILYPAELALTSMFSEGPSTELVVCRKRIA
jgi:SAM-dependent methyltransferase